MLILPMRRHNSKEWTELNPVLSKNEGGFEEDTRKFKMGDGVTPWNELEYYSSGSRLFGPQDNRKE